MYKNAYETIMESLPSSRQEISSFVDDIRLNIENENITGIEAMRMAKILDEISKLTKSIAQEYAMSEADLQDKTFSMYGATFTKTSRPTYKFDACGDVEYDKLVNLKNDIDKLIKDRESFLKTVRDEMSVNDTKTGEVYTIIPPVKRVTETLSIKL